MINDACVILSKPNVYGSVAGFEGQASVFSLDKNRLSKEINNEYIFTGCQILNKKVFQKKKDNIFSITEIWNDLINNRELHGYESTTEFVHLTDIEIFKKLN